MILDTCALLFLPSGDQRLSPAAREKLALEKSLYFCSVSAFEIAMKWRDKQLELPMEPHQWVKAVSQKYALQEIPLDSELCASAALLRLHHRDPCDRFIIAAARRLHVPVITTDAKFASYDIEVIS